MGGVTRLQWLPVRSNLGPRARRLLETLDEAGWTLHPGDGPDGHQARCPTTGRRMLFTVRSGELAGPIVHVTGDGRRFPARVDSAVRFIRSADD
jgi:hypothetical protein